LEGLDIDREMDVIGPKSSFSGNFKFGKYARIDGSLDGTISSEGIFITGERSHIKADLSGNIIIINGKFDGNITARDVLTLEPCSVVHGQINAPKVQIKDGALLNGTISMNKYHYDKLKELESF
jgi:cytoskeletal protein CcmA (bactofilin family)